MLTTAQVDHFTTFGFVARRDLPAEHTAALHAEVDTADFRAAYRLRGRHPAWRRDRLRPAHLARQQRRPRRLAGTTVYQPCPASEAESERTRRPMTDGYEQAFRGFDRERYPIWRDWLADAGSHPRRTPVIECVRAAGLLDLEGAEVGW